MKLKYIPFIFLMLTLACSSPETRVQTDVASPVEVEEIELKPIEEFVSATGTVAATQNVTLTAESAGYYRLADNPRTGKPFGIGDTVNEGDVIVHIDNPEQENTIRIDAQKLDLEISQDQWEQQQSLFEIGGVTQRELTNAEIAYINAKYSYENALIALSKLKVTAPFDGIIVDLPYFTPGVRVNSGATMAQVMNYEHLNMEVNLPGKLLGVVDVGMPVRTMNYTIPDVYLDGQISQVSPVLSPETRTFKATVNIENPKLILRPGMFVNSDIIIASNDSTIVVPKELILTRRNRKTVFVVDQGTAIERMVQTGLENPEEIEIVEGLEVRERLVVGGFETLRNRAKVTIVQ